jgi:ubiquinone/menaquinone biosynthesis C-methylase UbiE
MDLSEGMLAVATNRLRGRLAQADLRSLPIASSGLDAIWCVASLLHVPEPDTATVLGEFRRILRSAGQLALVTALGDSAEFEPVPYAPDEQRWYVFRDRDRLLDQLETAGFRVEADDRIAGNRDWLTVLAEAI